MGSVIIGMDPHKRSAAIEVIDERETVLVEGRNGIGRHIAQRLVADGEPVLDVPAKRSARARVFATGQGRKTDPVDAHSVALAGLHSTGLRVITADDATVALRLL